MMKQQRLHKLNQIIKKKLIETCENGYLLNPKELSLIFFSKPHLLFCWYEDSIISDFIIHRCRRTPFCDRKKLRKGMEWQTGFY